VVSLALATSVVSSCSTDGPSPTTAPPSETLIALGGSYYGAHASGLSCQWEGNVVAVRDGTGAVIGTTVMAVADRFESGAGCMGLGAWSVAVPKPSSGFYVIEIETDFGGGTVRIHSDLIPFDEASVYTRYLETEVDGSDFTTARIVPVSGIM
jgi:hypothetical protein